MKISRRSVIAGSGGAFLLPRVGFAQTPSVDAASTLVAIVQPEPTVMTTTANGAAPQGVVSTNIFDGLVGFGEDGSIVPSLAQSWDISSDGRTVTFHLRKDVRWHDGTPFTSADVRFSLIEILKKYHSRGRTNLSAVEQVDTPDAHTAVVRLSRPAPFLLTVLNSSDGQIIPRHLYEGRDFLTNPHNSKPIGTGAFKFKEWRRGEFIVLERNPDYWDKGKPRVQKLIFRIIPDASARAAALETGDVHYAAWDPMPFSDIERIKARPNLAITSAGYDFQSQMLTMEFNLKRPYVSDIRVRKAIAHAIDRRKLTDTVWYGVGRPAISMISSSISRFHNPNVPKYEFDVALANKILDEAGYARKADGSRFTLTHCYLPYNEAFRRNAEFMRQNLKDVGIETKIENVDLATYVRKVFTNYDFDLNSSQYACGIDPQLGLIRLIWSKSIKAGVPWTNASGYASPKMDELIEQQGQEMNPEKRSKLFHKIQELIQTDLPLLPLMEVEHVTVYNRRLKGVSAAPDAATASLKNLHLT